MKAPGTDDIFEIIARLLRLYDLATEDDYKTLNQAAVFLAYLAGQRAEVGAQIERLQREVGDRAQTLDGVLLTLADVLRVGPGRELVGHEARIWRYAISVANHQGHFGIPDLEVAEGDPVLDLE